MSRRALLIAVLVCTTWVAGAAVQPGLVVDGSAATPTESGETVEASNDTDDPDGSSTDGESDDTNETDGEDDSEDRWWGDSSGNESDDGEDNESEDRRWGGSSEDDSGESRWGGSSENDSEESRWGDSSGNESDAEEEPNESDAEDDPEESDAGDEPQDDEEDDTEDDRWWGDSSGNESDAEESDADDGPEHEDNETDGADESDERRRYVNLTEVVMNVTNGSVTEVTDLSAAEGANPTLAEEGDDVEVAVLNDTLVAERSGEPPVEGGDGAEVGLVDDSPVDAGYEVLVTADAAVTGLMAVPLSSVVAGLYTDVELADRPTAVDADVDDPDADADVVAGAWQPVAVDERDDAAVAAGEGGDGGAGEGGDSGAGDGAGGAGGAGAGAALFVLVGYLGGHRLVATQTVHLAGSGPRTVLASLRRAVGVGLGDVGLPFVPPVFGYSRQDGSDPLENDTRAEIYDLVTESPGIYYAQLAEETGVTEETVRYHSRILADEGLVERRKIRGRKRLYPVSMDGDDPEVAAAMADSAASDVISAIEHREPATLSAVAEAIGCAPSTVSYHLDRLEEDGLISRERDGSAVRIQLRRPTRTALDRSVADD